MGGISRRPYFSSWFFILYFFSFSTSISLHLKRERAREKGRNRESFGTNRVGRSRAPCTIHNSCYLVIRVSHFLSLPLTCIARKPFWIVALNRWLFGATMKRTLCRSPDTFQPLFLPSAIARVHATSHGRQELRKHCTGTSTNSEKESKRRNASQYERICLWRSWERNKIGELLEIFN